MKFNFMAVHGGALGKKDKKAHQKKDYTSCAGGGNLEGGRGGVSKEKVK